jgi:hypothetical protein
MRSGIRKSNDGHWKKILDFALMKVFYLVSWQVGKRSTVARSRAELLAGLVEAYSHITVTGLKRPMKINKEVNQYG